MPPLIDITGKRFGRLKVLGLASRDHGYVLWLCRCHCGKELKVSTSSLRTGNTRSCGCLSRETSSELCKKRAKDMRIGSRFGHLVVIGKSRKKLYSHGTCWLCRCDCGKRIVCWGTRLRNGNHKHCGCKTFGNLSKARKTHGLSYSPVYRVWKGMLSRCYYAKSDSYADYGGRGITVCREWRNHPEKFVAWSESHGYRKGLSIDRIDNDGNYSPSNCRWITKIWQGRNQRSNHVLTWKGKSKTIAEWADITGIRYHTISKRVLKYKWSVEDALTEEPSRNAWRRPEGRKKGQQ